MIDCVPCRRTQSRGGKLSAGRRTFNPIGPKNNVGPIRPRRFTRRTARRHKEPDMSSLRTVAMKLEVVVIPVSDVDRAKEFYGSLGWRLDADHAASDSFRIVQLTPPGSECSIQFGTGVTSAAPGSVQGLYLIVSDIEAARAELVARGVEVSEVFHEGGPG